MKNKKIIIIIAAIVVALLIGIGAGVYVFVIQPQNAAAANKNLGATDNNFGGRNLANFKSFSGKVLTTDTADMIVDIGTAQNDVVWDTTTQVMGDVTTDQTTVLKAGNTVSVNFTTDASGNKVATVITQEDLSNFAGAGGFPGAGGAPNGANPGANGAGRRNAQSGGGQGGQTGQNGNGPVRNANRTSYIGQVTGVNGTTLSISVAQGLGFNRNGDNTTSGTPTPTPVSMDFNIATATYKVAAVKKVSDIKIGDSIQVTGTLQGNGQTMARRIVIE